MSTSILPFNPGAALARVSATPTGFQIDCRGPKGARQYDFDRAGETAEFALVLRDDGGWHLRFGPDADTVRAIVQEIGGEAA